MTQPEPTTSDERLFAAISHLFGWLLALIIYFTQKDKSRFVRFQSLQALALDTLVILGTTIVMVGIFLVTFLALFIAMGIGIANIPQNSDPAGLWVWAMIFPTFLPLCVFPLVFVPVFGLWIVRIIAALRVFQGHDFRYPWLGRRVEKFLEG